MNSPNAPGPQTDWEGFRGRRGSQDSPSFEIGDGNRTARFRASCIGGQCSEKQSAHSVPPSQSAALFSPHISHLPEFRVIRCGMSSSVSGLGVLRQIQGASCSQSERVLAELEIEEASLVLSCGLSLWLLPCPSCSACPSCAC